MSDNILKTRRDETKWEIASSIVKSQYMEMNEKDSHFITEDIYQEMRKSDEDEMDKDLLRKAAEVSFIWPGYEDIDSNFIHGTYFLLKSYLDILQKDTGKRYTREDLKGLSLRWVTIRGQHVLVHGQPDGSWIVVGGAGGKLNHFKIDKLYSDKEYRAKLKEREETKKKIRDITPEEEKLHEERRKAELEEKTKVKEEYERHVSGIIDKDIKSHISVEDLDDIKKKAKERVQNKLKGKEISEQEKAELEKTEEDSLTAKKAEEEMKNIEKQALDILVNDYLGDTKDPADKKALAESLDIEKAKQVLAAKREFRKKIKDINKGITADETKLEIGDTWAVDSKGIDEAAMAEVLQHVETMKNVELYEKLSAQSSAIQKHIDTGALQAFNGIVGDSYQIGSIFSNKMIESIGIEGCAKLLATKMRQDGKEEDVKAGLIEYARKNNMKIVDKALKESESRFTNADEIRAMAGDLEGSDAILSRASANGYALRQLLRGQQALGDAVGSLRTTAHLINAFEESSQDTIHFDLGVDLARARKKARAMGLRRDEYKLKTEGSKLIMELDTGILDTWFERNRLEREKDSICEDIKAHKMNNGYIPQGIKKGVKLDPAQEAGLRFFSEKGKVLLDFEAGLGKTAVGYAAAMEAMNKFGAKKILIVTPAKLREQFYEERTKFLNEDKQGLVTLNDVSPKKREENYKKDGITIIGHEQLRTDRKFIKNAGYDMVVIDEFHEMTNPSETGEEDSQRFEGMMELKDIPYKIGMSGTNIKNSKNELYKKINFLDPQNNLGSMADFENKYKGINEGTNAYQDSSVEAFRKEIAPWVYSQKTNLNVKNNINEVKVPLSPEQKSLYRESESKYTRERKAGIKGAGSRRDVRNYDIIHDGIVGVGNNSKINQVMKIMDEKHPGEKAVIHVTGRKAIETLKTSLEKKYGEGTVVMIHGDTSRHQVEEGKKFFNDPDSKVRFMIGTKSLENGHNLQNGGTVTFHLDIPQTYASFDQRNKRIYRRGQNKDTNTYLLVSEAPYDVSRKDILTKKKKEMDIMGNTRHVEGYDESGFLAALNYREQKGATA